LRFILAAGRFSLVLLLVTPGIALANKKGPSLAPSVLAAKTIYIDNQTTDASLQNNAYMALARWGHLQVVDSAQKADVILRLTGSSYVRALPSDTRSEMTMASANTRAPAATDSAATSLLPNGYEAAPDGFTRLTLLDAKTNSAVWSDLSKTNTLQTATHLLDGLREAFEQGRKARDK